ncbi:MAG: glycosyl transferase [Alphaproteobacteria bacterium]|nr:MAG: glycosyl transferase [Alphaproteobacteria bacterium]
MTLYISARFLTQPASGVQRYARELLGAFDQRLAADPDLRNMVGPVVALYPATGIDDPGWSQIRLQGLSGGAGHLWEQGALWRASRDGTLLSLGNSGPLAHPAHILALHDANIYEIPQAYSRRYRLWHKVLRPALARRAAALISVSRFSATALAQRLSVPEARFSIVPNSAEHILRHAADPQALANRGLKPQGYWLSVANQSPNKNIARLVAAHQTLGQQAPPLVIVGGDAPGLASHTSGHPPGSARFLGRVSDAELRALYAGAAGFLFPSLYEGFGIPPLEAMALGVPVLAARRAALPEVLGNAAMWFDPLSVSDMARAMRALMALPAAARAQWIAAGQARAAGFTWQASVDQLIPVLIPVLRQTAVRTASKDLKSRALRSA